MEKKEKEVPQGANLTIDNVLMSDDQLSVELNKAVLEKTGYKFRRYFITYGFPEDSSYGFLKAKKQEIAKKLLSYYKGNLKDSKGEFEKGVLVDGALQFERGKENNLPHFHICLRFKNEVSYRGLVDKFKRWFNLNVVIKPIVGNKKSKDEGWSESYSYCTKEYTRIIGLPVECRKQYDWWIYAKPFDKFQRNVIKKIDEQSMREILFVIDPGIGGIGKSYIKGKMKHLSRIESPYSEYWVMNLSSSIKEPKEAIQSVKGMLDKGVKLYSKDFKQEHALIFIDIPRAGTGRLNPEVFATLLEEIKIGEIFDARYSHKEIDVCPPKMCVFLNDDIEGITIPNKEGEYYLSQDRPVRIYVPENAKRRVSGKDKVVDVTGWFNVE